MNYTIVLCLRLYVLQYLYSLDPGAVAICILSNTLCVCFHLYYYTPEDHIAFENFWFGHACRMRNFIDITDSYAGGEPN